MTTYKFADGFGIRGTKEDAQAVGEKLEAIEKREGGILPAVVVKEARAAGSPLHRYFTWDNTAAARLHRLEEARHLLRSVVIVQVTTKGGGGGPPVTLEVRAFNSLRPAGANSREPGPYLTTVKIMSHADTRRRFLQKALAEAENWMARYHRFAEFAEVCRAIQEAVKKLR